jgi:hypothetical protein
MPHSTPEKKAAWRKEYNSRPEIKARKAAYDREKKEKFRAWKKANPDKVKRHQKAKQLQGTGWTPEAVWEAEKQQEGKCAICNEVPPPRKPEGGRGGLCADHEHCIPPKPRELLCHSCNYGLGVFKDSPELLIKAAEYLRKWNRPCGGCGSCLDCLRIERS